MPCEIFNVVVIYDSARVHKAMVTYSHLAGELEDACTLDLRLGRLDLAVAPEFSAQVGRDIETDELMIVAVRGSEPCPSASMLERRGGWHAALRDHRPHRWPRGIGTHYGELGQRPASCSNANLPGDIRLGAGARGPLTRQT